VMMMAMTPSLTPQAALCPYALPAPGYLTFDMSGGPKGAKRPLGRPLDGGVGVTGTKRG